MPRLRSLLDGFFQARDPRDVLRAVASLGDPSARPEDRSHGRVLKPESFFYRSGRAFAERDGLDCARLFGPLEDLQCTCCKYHGAASEGVVCEKCGVLCGSSGLRKWRFGHIEAAGGVLHPALVPAIASTLDLRPDDVRDIVAYRAWLEDGAVHPAPPVENVEDEEEGLPEMPYEKAGLKVLVRALESAAAVPGLPGVSPRDLVPTVVPVLPPGDRPPVLLPEPTSMIPLTGTVTLAYASLVSRVNRRLRLLELGAWDILVAAEDVQVQRAFERLLQAVERGNAPPESWGPFGEGKTLRIQAPEPAEAAPPDRRSRPRACLFLDEDRALFQLAGSILEVSLTDGKVLSRHPPTDWLARSADAPGHRVVFMGTHPGPLLDPEDTTCDLGVLDLRSGAWLTEFPRDLPAVVFWQDQPEDAALQNLRTDVLSPLHVPSDRPQLLCVSRDHRFLWVGEEDVGVIASAETGLPHVDVGDLGHEDTPGLPHLREDGSLRDGRGDGDADGERDEEDETDEEEEESPVCAIAVTKENRWRVLRPDGLVGENRETLFRLGFTPLAAAWSSGGERLLLLTAGEALIVEASRRPRITKRIPLPSLRGRAGKPRRGR